MTSRISGGWPVDIRRMTGGYLPSGSWVPEAALPLLAFGDWVGCEDCNGMGQAGSLTRYPDAGYPPDIWFGVVTETKGNDGYPPSRFQTEEEGRHGTVRKHHSEKVHFVRTFIFLKKCDHCSLFKLFTTSTNEKFVLICVRVHTFLFALSRTNGNPTQTPGLRKKT